MVTKGETREGINKEFGTNLYTLDNKLDNQQGSTYYKEQGTIPRIL